MEWANIQGWFDFADIYQQMVNHFPNGSRFVEIGSWLGRSTVFMAEQIKRSGKSISLDAVDKWEGIAELVNDIRWGWNYLDASFYDMFLENLKLCNVDEYVFPIRANSLVAHTLYPDESIDFLFLDTDHQFHTLTKELEYWYPKVKKGGIIAGHDLNWPGVKTAVALFFLYKLGISEIIEIEPDGHPLLVLPKGWLPRLQTEPKVFHVGNSWLFTKQDIDRQHHWVEITPEELKERQKQPMPVVDLEAIANHNREIEANYLRKAV